jgi:hypothetical protein
MQNQNWVTVTRAPNQMEAEMIVELLAREGIPARLSAADSMSFLGGLQSPMTTAVLVPAERENEALRWLEAEPSPEPPSGGYPDES